MPVAASSVDQQTAGLVDRNVVLVMEQDSHARGVPGRRATRSRLDLPRTALYGVTAMSANRRIRTIPRVAITLGLGLGLTLGACTGRNTVTPEQCLRDCEQTCPYTPDGVGDNDDYIECVEACHAKCSG